MGEPDAVFAEPRLAAVYDAFDADRSDLEAYLAIVEELDARDVLDVGCGTGSLASLLAVRGAHVTAIDPAAASIAVAQAKPGAELVTWFVGDAVAWAAARPDDTPLADLAVMTGNVAQVFVSNAEWVATLAAIHASVRSGGHLVFETRRPDFRAWEQWQRDTAAESLDIPDVGRVERSLEVTDVALPMVSFRFTFRFGPDGGAVEGEGDPQGAGADVVTSESTVRFRELPEIEASLQVAGFDVIDVRDAPDRLGREYVIFARRP